MTTKRFSAAQLAVDKIPELEEVSDYLRMSEVAQDLAELYRYQSDRRSAALKEFIAHVYDWLAFESAATAGVEIPEALRKYIESVGALPRFESGNVRPWIVEHFKASAGKDPDFVFYEADGVRIVRDRWPNSLVKVFVRRGYMYFPDDRDDYETQCEDEQALDRLLDYVEAEY